MGASLDTDSVVAAQQIALMSVDNPSIRDPVPYHQAEKSDCRLNGLLYIPGYAVGVFVSLCLSSATANLITSLSTLKSTGITELGRLLIGKLNSLVYYINYSLYKLRKLERRVKHRHGCSKNTF